MNLTCIIIEDEPLARNLLTEYIAMISTLELLESFSNPVKALDFLRTREPDILFLDVQMPEITGISLLKILKTKPIVILTTAYSEYAIEGYELDVTDYLLKPITFERFLKAVEKATDRLADPGNSSAKGTTIREEAPATLQPIDYLFVKDGTRHVKLRLNEIRFIKGLKDYIAIHTPKGKITTLQRLKTLEEQLPASHFVRVHHSYIVALEWIDIIDRDSVQIGETVIPVSDTYRKAFKAIIDQKHLDNLGH
ncbi:LytR/AlgR family response regulator transcription factor [Flavilitoribacter nigricans]|uniref:DNA-binding response regulator n=1 Tax=Flavilitoribacter nigricans (strain ATCC 23147 / DSM 23189 / NBRC 102662 / NCIMB 1420 / SS-2) TaxID=1122177 RepID=A0A2D0NIZ2_FLAN2|nr:LytTR family DNA-binding domain-containing protein [Flavilitoribacter nigricans]PHN08360.1 DNA-binding response regulator [Flavilitoribacter nigricans DSM 23189 = NBRC 102662]